MTGWTETHRSMVKAWECDSFGHFTVAFYFDRFADASMTHLELLARERGFTGAGGWAATGYHARFVQELRAGEALHLESGVIEVGPTLLRLGHRVLNSASGAVCTTIEERLEPRPGAAALTEGERRHLVATVIPWEAAKDDPGFADDATSGLIASGRDRVRPAELDEHGELGLAGYVHRSSIGSIQLLATTGLTPDYLREAGRGFSTFEIKLRLDPPGPTAGTSLQITSGLLQLGSSSVRMIHRLTDARSGRRVATLRQSGVHFDLTARRSTPIPEALRAKAAALVMHAS